VPDDRNQRVEQLFAEAMQLPADERAGFLARACPDDLELRREVESLVNAHDLVGDFLGTADRIRATTLLNDGEPTDSGERIGAYRVIRELGRGGMGVVYLAKRADGQFEQKVALKLIKRGMDSDEIQRRFLMERQILARLQHPNIARLLDGGVTDQGQLYFAMEFVEGTPLIRFCDENELGIEARLQLFLSVCRGVRSAHRQLVVHRDLKPSNILVTHSGEPKLLDFGIAKLLDTDRDDGQTLTRAGLRLATPEYGAPEQLRGEPVTTSTDTYALGVILYELLTGQRPYRFERNKPEAMEQVISRTVPTRPSVVVGRPRDVRRLRGDLDTIALKALRAEPERRYASVESLQEDIENYLNGLPVKAREDTLAYRTVKFVSRHRLAVVAVLIMAVSLAGGVSAVLWQSHLTAAEAAKAREVQAFLVEMFIASDPAQARGEELSARDLLERGAERVDTELVAQPDFRADMIWLIGSLFDKLGQYDRAEALYEQSLEARRELYGPVHLDVAESLLSLGSVIREQGKFERAEPLLREALEIHRQELPNGDPEIGQSLNDLGLMLAEAGDYESSEAMLRECLAIYRQAYGAEHERVAGALSNLAQIIKWKGDLETAETLYRESIAMRRKLLGDDHPKVAITVGNLGSLFLMNGDLAAAEPLLRESLEIRRRVLGENHPDVALNLNNLAAVYSESRNYVEAEPLYRQAWEMNKGFHGDRNWRVATNMHNLGAVLMELGDYTEAELLLAGAEEQRREFLGEDHPRLADTLMMLADLRLRQGDLEGAEALLAEAFEVRDRAGQGAHPRRATTLLIQGRLRLIQNRPAEAEPLLRQAMEIREQRLIKGHWRRAEAQALLGECLVRLERTAEAEPLLRRGCEGLQELLIEDDPLRLRVERAQAEL
jgi:serine/threonine-protein kinase